MNIGHLELCLNVKDLQRSLDFYHKLGYEDVSVFLKDKWAIEDADIILYFPGDRRISPPSPLVLISAPQKAS